MAVEINVVNNPNQISRGLFIPTKIMENGNMSATSEANRCFVSQKFSANLQAFMVNYVISVASQYSVYS